MKHYQQEIKKQSILLNEANEILEVVSARVKTIANATTTARIFNQELPEYGEDSPDERGERYLQNLLETTKSHKKTAIEELKYIINTLNDDNQ